MTARADAATRHGPELIRGTAARDTTVLSDIP